MLAEILRILPDSMQRAPVSLRSSGMVTLLAHLRDSGERVVVKFPDKEDLYTCKVTALSAIHGVFVLDAFTPAIPERRLRRGRNLTVFVENGDEFLAFHTSFIEQLVENQDCGYEFRVPFRPEPPAPCLALSMN